MPYHVQFPGFGWEFDINPIAFSIGDYKVYWYGIIIACGLLLAVLYAWKSAPRYKVDGSKLINCVFAGIITELSVQDCTSVSSNGIITDRTRLKFSISTTADLLFTAE